MQNFVEDSRKKKGELRRTGAKKGPKDFGRKAL